MPFSFSDLHLLYNTSIGQKDIFKVSLGKSFLLKKKRRLSLGIREWNSNLAKNRICFRNVPTWKLTHSLLHLETAKKMILTYKRSIHVRKMYRTKEHLSFTYIKLTGNKNFATDLSKNFTLKEKVIKVKRYNNNKEEIGILCTIYLERAWELTYLLRQALTYFISVAPHVNVS